ncbi:glutathione-dependent formaldehyde-activating enzyme [Cordyceps fumosorosea ARSEF 2679]|uniref:Glutathione-dependent formaldehyde-activating enzyme n=1 Tax=Cordyceps fumosorosea (strain ARSEF 2679) TaxID=1081104 RepID=A0A168EAZ0_CORFA|nr:glutathione-dependent formaldehyde-activating enzyme [Cordyceps fumosorosea ARSEF 2679]OAA73593.1 glutathione-dependent formaldehyde-activating enzyme [Cordyceps fumosorosea ARSEF 2679]
MASDEAAPLRTYRGNCHCGAFVYEAELPEITAATECPCSICRKKGYLLVGANTETAHFKVVKGSLKSLPEYTFGTKALCHKFCSNCGTAVLATVPSAQAPEKNIYLNVHAIQGIDTWTLKRTPVDGTKIGAPYEEPKHTGPVPTVEVEGGKLYTGSCHCGKLTIAAKIKRLEDDKDSGMIECNCSICERNAYLWVYPKAEQVVLSGRAEDTGLYRFNHEVQAKPFCRTCGVSMSNPSNAATTANEAAARLPYADTAQRERVREYVEKHRTMHPVNVRVLHGVDFQRLHVKRFDGAKLIPPPYVNP